MKSKLLFSQVGSIGSAVTGHTRCTRLAATVASTSTEADDQEGPQEDPHPHRPPKVVVAVPANCPAAGRELREQVEAKEEIYCMKSTSRGK